MPVTPPHRLPAGALIAAVAALVVVALAAAGCGSGDGRGAGRPTTVVTTTALGAVVGELVGDAADVRVLMPDGVDPHDFQPSARDAAALGDAELVVENGLGLEEGMSDTIAAARDDGVAIFTATDHVRLRELPQGGEEGGGGPDPHIWMDPLAMRDVVRALVPVLDGELGLDLTARGGALAGRLEDLDAELRASLAAIPPARRRLVTGHESMGYFAGRYDLALVGALIPSSSSQAQVSASSLADLRARVEREDVAAIFSESGTPADVARAIADQTGARVVEIASHNLPDDGSYFTFMREVAAAVVDGLTREG